MPGAGKASKDKPKNSMQSKLTNFGPQTVEKLAASASKEANVAGEGAGGGETTDRATVSAEGKEANADNLIQIQPGNDLLFVLKEEIVGEIRSLRTEFSGRFDGVMKAIEDTQKQMSECTERMDEVETRLSSMEDSQIGVKTEVERLGKRNKYLEEKLIDLETRSRSNNLRLVNLPEGAEGPDTCVFLESWLPEALDMLPSRHPVIIEKAHRVGPKRDSDTKPRTLIMKFLNYRQKELVTRAARSKKEIMYKNQRVRFFSDVATEVHKQRKQFDAARQHLRQLGLRHGIIPPAILVLTYKEAVYKFTAAAEAQNFIKKIQEEMEQTQIVS